MSPLILECARAHPDPDKLRRLSGVCSDWDGLIESASKQGLAPLVFWALNRACQDTIPPEPLTKLRTVFKQSTKQSLIFSAELLRLLDLFRRADIPVISFKGPVLAWSLYEASGLRTMSDLDLLVPECEMGRTIDLLSATGYRRRPADNALRFLTDAGQLSLQRPGEPVSVDLHWRISAAHFNPLDAASLWKHLAFVDVAGQQTPTLCPEDLLLFLCLHSARHGCFGLRWLCDLARLVDTHQLDWDAIMAHSEGVRMSRIVSLGLCLAQDLLGSSLPPEVSRRIHSDARVVALATSIYTRFLDGRVGSSRDTTILTFRLTEGPWRKFLFLWYRLQPTAADWEALHLPESMFPAYYLIRPVRLAWKWCMQPNF